ncbi:MAG: deoxynucleoside kinase [Mycoplasmatales bacterium]
MKNVNSSTTIAIAGTVGIGKSTLTKLLSQRLGLKTSFENVEQNPYLDKYYSDFKRWGFHLQIFFLAERFKAHKEIHEFGGGFIIDRTIYEDVEIFAKMNYENGTMDEEDYQTYCQLFEAMVYSPYFKPPDLVIYVEGDIKDILKRINTRGRKSEINTSIEYWHKLHERYAIWIKTFRETRLLRININDYDVEDDTSIDSLLKKIDDILE